MIENKIKFIVSKEGILRDFLKENLSKKLYKRLRCFGSIKVNGQIVDRNTILKINDEVLILYLVAEKNEWPKICKIPKIIYECNDYIVVYKEANLLTIPTKGNPRSLYQMLLYYFEVKKENANISFINRLDYETQGLILVAKNRNVAYLFNSHKKDITRMYYAYCEGEFTNKKGRIETFIAKNGNKRYVSDEGKLAITLYEVIKEENAKSLVRFHLLTGRTHQIRVHSAYLGHSIIGDKTYGKDNNCNIMYLCSYYLAFKDYKSGEIKEFIIKPEWM